LRGAIAQRIDQIAAQTQPTEQASVADLRATDKSKVAIKEDFKDIFCHTGGFKVFGNPLVPENEVWFNPVHFR
jgi:hypothetical protein